jgi:hypothetical protein
MLSAVVDPSSSINFTSTVPFRIDWGGTCARGATTKGFGRINLNSIGEDEEEKKEVKIGERGKRGKYGEKNLK